MKNKRNVLYSLAIMLVGVIYFPGQAQQKNGTHVLWLCSPLAGSMVGQAVAPDGGFTIA